MRHGTTTGYDHHGCRCDDCWDAHRKAQRHTTNRPLPPPEGAGTLTGEFIQDGTEACAGLDPDVFFAPHNERPEARAKRQRIAKAACAGCPRQFECLAHARIRGEKFGIWGGHDFTEDYLPNGSRRRKAGQA